MSIKTKAIQGISIFVLGCLLLIATVNQPEKLDEADRTPVVGLAASIDMNAESADNLAGISTAFTLNYNLIQTASLEKVSTDITSSAAISEEDYSNHPAREDEEIVSVNPWEKRVYVNADDYLNVRSTPSTEGEIVGIMKAGTIGTILEQTEGWTKMSSNNVVGYVNNEYCLFGEAAKIAAYADGDNKALVLASGLRVHETASTEGEVVTTLDKDAKVSVDYDLPYVVGFVAVKVDGEEGYVSSQYVRVAEELPTGITYSEYQEELRIAKEKAEAAAAAKAAAEAKAAAAKAAAVSQQAATIASTSELKLLATIIYCEAGHESYTGQVAVGSVVMNRVRSSRFPSSISGVIYASGQFSPVSSGSYARALANDLATSSCYAAAKEALAGADVVGGRMFFHVVRSGNSGLIIGNHYFY